MEKVNEPHPQKKTRKKRGAEAEVLKDEGKKIGGGQEVEIDPSQREIEVRGETETVAPGAETDIAGIETEKFAEARVKTGTMNDEKRANPQGEANHLRNVKLHLQLESPS